MVQVHKTVVKEGRPVVIGNVGGREDGYIGSGEVVGDRRMRVTGVDGREETRHIN